MLEIEPPKEPEPATVEPKMSPLPPTVSGGFDKVSVLIYIVLVKSVPYIAAELVFRLAL
jgi:hypothetical protein